MSKDEELDFELEDIFDEIKINYEGIATNDETVLEANIIYILKREKLWKKHYSICFPSGATAWLDVGSSDDDPSSYSYDFEVFSNPNTVVASGTITGSLMVCRKSEDEESDDYSEIKSVEVIDMDLAINEYKPQFLDKKDKEVVQFD